MRRDFLGTSVRQDGSKTVIRTDAAPLTIEAVETMLSTRLKALLETDLPKVLKDTLAADKTAAQAAADKAVADKAAADKAAADKAAADKAVADAASGIGDPHTKAALMEANKKLADTQKQVDALLAKNTEAETRAERMEREGALKTELTKFTFIKPEAADAAFRMLLPDLVRGEDGSLTAGGLPVDTYVKQALTEKHDYWLAGTATPGTGAARSVAQVKQGQGIQLEQIKPGMSQAEYEQAMAATLAALKS